MDRKVVGVVFFGMVAMVAMVAVVTSPTTAGSIYLSICLSIYLSVYPSIHLSIYLSIYLSVYLSIYLFIFKLENEAILRDFLSFELDNVKNEAIMRGLLSFRCWEPQKRSNSARLPSTMESWVQSWRLVPMHFAIFPLHLSKVLRLPRKSDARSYEVLHLSRKIILANLKIWCSKMQPVSGNQRPDLLTSMMNMSLVLRLPHERHLCRSSSNVPRLPTLLKLLQNPHIFPNSWQGAESLVPATQNHIWTFKWRACGGFDILTSKCASRQNGVHFFDMSTSKSGPRMVWFDVFL